MTDIGGGCFVNSRWRTALGLDLLFVFVIDFG
jgi:hypothetical protein